MEVPSSALEKGAELAANFLVRLAEKMTDPGALDAEKLIGHWSGHVERARHPDELPLRNNIIAEFGLKSGKLLMKVRGVLPDGSVVSTSTTLTCAQVPSGVVGVYFVHRTGIMAPDLGAFDLAWTLTGGLSGDYFSSSGTLGKMFLIRITK